MELEDLIKKKKQVKLPGGTEIAMYLDCQDCGEEVDKAMHFRNETLLVWTCSQGHKSHIENFRYE